MNRFLRFAFVPLVALAFLASIPSNAASADAPGGVYTVVRHVLVAPGDEPVVETSTRVSAQFVVNTNLWGAADVPVGVSYNSAGTVAAQHDVATIIQEAIGTWNAVTPSSFSFSYQGTSSGGPGSCDAVIHLDGVNTVAFAHLEGLLGLTCTVYFGSGAQNKLVEFDMVLSGDPALWSSGAITPPGRFDLPTTILHELGHAAGLGHSHDDSVMDGTLAPGVQRRSLAEDDIAGLRAAYPPVQSPATAGPAANGVGALSGTRLYSLRAALVAYD